MKYTNKAPSGVVDNCYVLQWQAMYNNSLAWHVERLLEVVQW